MTKGERKKEMWAKKRAQKEKQRIAEAEKAKPMRRKKVVREFRPLQPQVSRHVMTEGMLKAARLPSNVAAVPSVKDSVIELTPDMAEREKLAQQEISRKKKRVAPLYNKGGYQYVGDAPPEIIQTLGRKI